jgi:hypothetical protein
MGQSADDHHQRSTPMDLFLLFRDFLMGTLNSLIQTMLGLGLFGCSVIEALQELLKGW